ncbi:MAG: DNA topoisomerase IV subunit B, partial [Lactobacillaceae bacterium]|nr:DNA topoisomerase IV subunit B [Lactobacillaceae bacterium]
MVKKEYNNISTIEGLAAIRKRPGMYVGSPQSLDGKNPSALLQIAQEILSNAIDEAYAGFGNVITFTIHEDNSVTVTDKGRGMPMGNNFDSVIRGFTVLHSSGKFDSSNYASSIGQNGIGNKAVTALSKWVKVKATTVHESYEIEFNQENVVSKSKKTAKGDTGTSVTFLPDDEIFDTIVWDDKPLINKLEQSAFLTPRVKFIFTDERKKNEEGNEFYTKSWYSEKGMPDYVAYIAQGEELVSGLKAPISFNDTYENENRDVISVQGALLYTENAGETIISFANGAPTSDGGPHEDGAKIAISKAFIDFAKDKKLINGNKTLDASDTRDGMILALLVKIPENILMFESQSKTKLATVASKEATRKVMYDALTAWLYDNEKSAKKIIEKMMEARDAREAAVQARKVAKAARDTKNGGGKLFVSSKLMPASSKNRDERELYIVEGDSAGGATKKARNPKTQAIFPIRGKLLNTQNEKLTRILANEEISTIASVLGAGIGPAFDLKDIQYDKV